MIWKVVLVLSVTLCVLGHQDAISEQRVTIHFQKSGSKKSLPLVDSIKADPQDQNSWENPSYEFSYKVNDPETHDIKGQHEIKEGDEVTGNYWLIEPNGKKRTVNYQANDDKGFNAQIEYTASLKNEEGVENIEISQNTNEGKSDFEENNNDVIENNVTERIDDVEEAQFGFNGNESDTEGSEEENQVDNEKDGTEHINSVISSNTDRTRRRNRNPTNQKNISHNENRNIRVSNKSRRKNRTDNGPENITRDKKRNKTHARFPSRIVDENESKHDVHRNSNEVKHEIINSKENNNKRQQLKDKQHDKNINLPHNSSSYRNNSSNLITSGLRITTSQEQNSNTESEISKKKNEDDNGKNSIAHNDAGNFQPNIDRSDMPDSDIYEHRIRILHSKIIPSNTKEEQT